MDMNKGIRRRANPVILKSEFIMSLCEQLIGGTNLGAKRSLSSTVVRRAFTETISREDIPVLFLPLQDFRAELLKQDEPEAKKSPLLSSCLHTVL